MTISGAPLEKETKIDYPCKRGQNTAAKMSARFTRQTLHVWQPNSSNNLYILSVPRPISPSVQQISVEPHPLFTCGKKLRRIDGDKHEENTSPIKCILRSDLVGTIMNPDVSVELTEKLIKSTNNQCKFHYSSRSLFVQWRPLDVLLKPECLTSANLCSEIFANKRTRSSLSYGFLFFFLPQASSGRQWQQQRSCSSETFAFLCLMGHEMT